MLLAVPAKQVRSRCYALWHDATRSGTGAVRINTVGQSRANANNPASVLQVPYQPASAHLLPSIPSACRLRINSSCCLFVCLFVLQVVGVCRCKPVSVQPLDVLDEEREAAAVGQVLAQLKRIQVSLC
jgi:hypothetical protein